MKPQQSVEDALALLEQMRDYPNVVLQALDEAELSSTMQELDVLAKRAAIIQSGADLFQLADAIHQMVEDRPGLGKQFLPKEIHVIEQSQQRGVYEADQQATMDLNMYAKERAPQIYNSLVEVRGQLDAALLKIAESKQKSDQGKSHDNSKH